MSYCLACGMNRDTDGGMCGQCREDRRVKVGMEAKCVRVRVLREASRERMRAHRGT